jgi:hypothetical protein
MSSPIPTSPTRRARKACDDADFAQNSTAVLALGGEEPGPRIDMGMLLEERPPLTFSLAAPDTELHLVVERVGEALRGDGTVPADDSHFSLLSSGTKNSSESVE